MSGVSWAPVELIVNLRCGAGRRLLLCVRSARPPGGRPGGARTLRARLRLGARSADGSPLFLTTASRSRACRCLLTDEETEAESGSVTKGGAATAGTWRRRAVNPGGVAPESTPYLPGDPASWPRGPSLLWAFTCS